MSSAVRALAASAVFAGALVVWPVAAGAQAPGAYAPPPPPPPPPAAAASSVREGFTIGIGIGGGSIELVDDGQRLESLDGVSFHLGVGGMVTERVAILGELWGIVHVEEDDFGGEASLSHGIAALAVQFWATPRLWLKGGIGQGQFTARDSGGYEAQSDTVPAALFAAGYELAHSRTFALDVQLRFGVADYGNDEQLHNGALALGLNWY